MRLKEPKVEFFHDHVELSRAGYSVSVSRESFKRWLDGTYIQDAMPELSAEQREFLITGLTPDEWNELFGEEEDEE